MDIFTSALFGLLQGLTEFLPVSSSGHLALARGIFEFNPGSGALYEALLHLGTAGSIVVVFRRDLQTLLGGVMGLFRPAQWRSRYASDSTFRDVILLLVSAIPAGLIGILFKDRIEALFDEPRTVSLFIIVTGLILAASRWIRPGTRPIGWRTTIAMGCAQAVAILPGISRSGSTIVAGLSAGSSRTSVGRFAFLMGLIPILGAGILELRHVEESKSPEWSVIAVGVVVAFVVGIVALRLLLRFVASGRLYFFAPYCIGVGVLGYFLT